MPATGSRGTSPGTSRRASRANLLTSGWSVNGVVTLVERPADQHQLPLRGRLQRQRRVLRAAGSRRRSVLGDRRAGQVPEPHGVRGALHAERRGRLRLAGSTSATCRATRTTGRRSRTSTCRWSRTRALATGRRCRCGSTRSTCSTTRTSRTRCCRISRSTSCRTASTRRRIAASASCRSPRRRMSAGGNPFLGGGGPRAFQLAAQDHVLGNMDTGHGWTCACRQSHMSGHRGNFPSSAAVSLTD